MTKVESSLTRLALFSLLAAVPLLGCPADGDDDSAEGGDDGDGSGDDGDGSAGDDGSGTMGADDGATGMVDSTGGDDGAGACPGAGGAAADGEACTSNSDCMSGVCLLFGDVPTPDDATCEPTPADCNTRVTGTVFDLVTGERVSGANVRIASALSAAGGPTTAMGLVEGATDGMGRFDQTTAMPISAQLGIVALAEAGGYFLTATGAAGPDDAGVYDVANGIHDWWLVPTSALDEWSTALGMDKAVPAANLPLGDTGGVVGLVRDATGAPVTRAVIVSQLDDSGAVIRYLNDDGTFGTEGTGEAGIFVILAPSLAEQFRAEVDGEQVAGPGTAGSANGAVFTLIMNVAG